MTTSICFIGWGALSYILLLLDKEVETDCRVELGVARDENRGGFIYSMLIDNKEKAKLFKSEEELLSLLNSGNKNLDLVEEWEHRIVEQLVSRYRLASARGV